MSKIGIPQYNDQINETELAELKKMINIICLNFSKIATKESCDNRNSEVFDTYANQYAVDLNSCEDMIIWGQKLINKLNDIMFTLSVRRFGDRLYNTERNKILKEKEEKETK